MSSVFELVLSIIFITNSTSKNTSEACKQARRTRHMIGRERLVLVQRGLVAFQNCVALSILPLKN